jgi:hypothetical protein
VGDVILEEGIPPGKYRVAVNASEIIDAEAEKVRWLAPPRYADFRTSGLVVHVKAHSSDMRIELQSSTGKEMDDMHDESAGRENRAADDAAASLTERKPTVERQEAREK